jgi:hypothetical protein
MSATKQLIGAFACLALLSIFFALAFAPIL